MMSKRSRTRPVLLAALSLMLSACAGSMSDLTSYIEEVKGRQGGTVEPLPRVEDPPTFEYSAGNLRDPFTGGPFDQPSDPIAPTGELAEGPKPDFNRRREDLESFELDSLEMVGTFSIDGVTYGLVEDPDGLLHRVKEDNYLGRNHGRIIAVSDDRIRLTELTPDGPNRWRETTAELALDAVN